MRLFDWFRRPPLLTTQFWLDEPSRMAGTVAELRRRIDLGQHVAVVAHFPAGLIEVGQQLSTAGIEFETLTRWTSRDDELLRRAGAPRVVAMLAQALPEPNDLAVAPAGELRFAVLAVELHVLADANERVRRFAAERPVRGEAVAFASFDSPHVSRMVGANVRAMLQRVGMKPEEPIENPMVTRGIEKALAKLARRVRGNTSADSLAEWLQRNLAE